MGGLDGKVALVTGANRGIGKGIARGLGREGARVVITARSIDQLETTAAELRSGGGTVVPVPADVTSESQVERLFAKTIESFGRLDVLVNNAGAFDDGPIDEMSLEAWSWVIAVNLTGPFLCTRAAMRVMKQQGGGRIINVASISAQRVRPGTAAYSSSKHGLWGLTQVTALEGRDHGIAASCLYPGNTRVERREENGGGGGVRQPEPMMTVDELAQAAVWMALLPPHVNMLEATVLPVRQAFVGRG
jgi:NAD(P)-dependent dehydrogenase (short-subunit alcohol dehydrogenase family)